MKYYFFPPHIGKCTVKLWAKGKYGFSTPQRVEITAPDGWRCVYSYRNVNESAGLELTGKILMRIANGHFLADPRRREEIVELDSNMPMFDGRLVRPCAWPRCRNTEEGWQKPT